MVPGVPAGTWVDEYSMGLAQKATAPMISAGDAKRATIWGPHLITGRKRLLRQYPTTSLASGNGNWTDCRTTPGGCIAGYRLLLAVEKARAGDRHLWSPRPYVAWQTPHLHQPHTRGALYLHDCRELQAPSPPICSKRRQPARHSAGPAREWWSLYHS
jgi:hypothetical protein